MEFLLAGYPKACLYAKALEAVKPGKELDVTEFYLCPVCGYTYSANDQRSATFAVLWVKNSCFTAPNNRKFLNQKYFTCEREVFLF